MSDWGVDVSRETIEKLECYEALLKKWNPAINLVSKSTIENLRSRHIQDSVQIFDLMPENAKSWADIGSGGGFPGLVCAIMAAEKSPETQFYLIESDVRKAAFLKTVSRETGAGVTVIDQRIERIEPLSVDVVSARALAELDKLFEYSIRHLGQEGVCLFPKGSNYQTELDKAQQAWSFDCEKLQSKTEENAVVLKIGGLKRA